MKRSVFYILIMVGLINLFVVACATSNQVDQNAKPIAHITSPALNSILPIAEEVLITFSVADVAGVNRVELLINGQMVMSEAVDPPVNSYAASHRWTPDASGNQIIELRTFNTNNISNDLLQHIVTVTEAETEAEPVAEAEVEVSATDTPAPDTPTPTPVIFDTPTSEPTATPEATETAVATAASTAIVTSLVRLNVRLGPTTAYPVAGTLDVDKSALITGRDELSIWWQIEYPSDYGDRGWVSASSDYTTASNAENVPVASAPSLESVASPTPIPTSTPIPEDTATSVAATATPDSLKPTIYTFSADRYTIVSGESVKLSWDLGNAHSAYLRYDGQEEGVVAPGDKTVSPSQETVYTLVARNDHGETTSEITIKIGDSTPTPASVYRDGKIRIADGQYVDFDQGLILAAADINSDFAWNGTTQQFYPQPGASGTLLSRPYEQITLADCQSAAYDKPIDGVDGSTQVTGCYITSEGRYGKFLVSEWDLAANLTIQWLTWNY